LPHAVDEAGKKRCNIATVDKIHLPAVVRIYRRGGIVKIVILNRSILHVAEHAIRLGFSPRNCFLHRGSKNRRKLANLQAFPAGTALISFL
jgi:hypothetical protein